ncbi:MAG: heat-inducible transcriptional repressor [Frankiaceae bacterium]|jgi:heat-inducible transcriptional repressor|nr:heat-inducible transcriptional repressor [Frankiaceae bacterium]
MLDERKLEVLRAIVSDFVSSHEPVGSRALVERHSLAVSPATIRNDMAVLEDEGLITQPHTSAGRVPTDKGYRVFVDRLSSVKPLSVAERRAIQSFLEGAVDLDDVVTRTVRLLAQLTGQVAVVQYPTMSRSAVRHIEIVAVGATKLLLVVITDTGRVDQRIVDVSVSVGDDDLRQLRNAVNQRVAGRRVAEAGRLIGDLPESLPPALHGVARTMVSVIRESLVDRPDERVVLAGTANLARTPHDLAFAVRPVLEALEEQVVLLKLLGEADDPSTVSVTIGGENAHSALQSASVVSVAYGSDDRVLAGLGVLGPTAMDYPGTMAAVRAVARYVGKIIAEG